MGETAVGPSKYSTFIDKAITVGDRKFEHLFPTSGSTVTSTYTSME